MDLNLDRLQELAEGANNWCDEWVVSAAFQQRNAWDKHTSNYLAALDPRTILALIERLRRAEEVVEKLLKTADGVPVLTHCPWSVVYWLYPNGTIAERCAREIKCFWNSKANAMEYGISLSSTRPGTFGMMVDGTRLLISRDGYSTRAEAEAALARKEKP